jgi:serine/threonine-protein kinase RsbW/stage II sporulation protein AB (anti-sigma F factor)
MSATRDQWRGRAEPSVVAELRHAAGSFAQDAGFYGMALADVRACVSEAVTNSVVHAFRDGRAPGTVTLSAELSADELVCIVTDDGTGFRPRDDSPGIGLGLPTIAAATASMSLTPADRGGTRLCMAFTRKQAVLTAGAATA